MRSKLAAHVARTFATHITVVTCAPCKQRFEWPGKQPARYVCRLCGADMRVEVRREEEAV